MRKWTVSRLAWMMFGLVAFVYLAGLIFSWLNRFTHHPGVSAFDPLVLVFFAFPVVGAAVAKGQPRNPIGWILLGIGLSWGIYSLLNGYALYGLFTNPGSVPRPDLSLALNSWTWIPSVGLMGMFLILLFPDGRLPSPRWRWLARFSGTTLVVTSVATLVAPGPFTDMGFPSVANPLGIDALRGISGVITAASVTAILLSIAGCTVGLIVRFRRSKGQERLQMKWLAAAASFVALGYVTSMTINGLYYYSDGSQTPAWFDAIWEIALFSFVLIPIAVGIAILKHRLYEIDVIITKTVVFGTLAAFITAVYVAVVAGVAAVLGSGREPNLFLSILATVIVAVAFQPVRERVQRFANRLVYGQRATPYEVLTLFSRSLAALVSAEEVLPEIARHTAEGLGAQSVKVTMDLPQGREEAHYPEEEPARGDHLEETVPVTYQGVALGEIVVTKPPTEPFRAPERRLLEGLAAHAGVVLHNYQLTLELRARLKELSEQADKLKSSRERLVTAADTSRRGIERAIRERVERRLIGIAEDLGVTEAAMRTDPAGATGMLEGLALRTNETLEVLRDLARGIYPPLLADKGLVMALEAHIRKTGLEASLSVDPALEGVRFDRSIETSCYFCIREALDNVSLHARGAEALVTLEQSAGRVSFSVTDEGPGFDPSVVTGAASGLGGGLQAMADRLAASGGELTVESKPGQGTAVTGWVPLSDQAETETSGESEAEAAAQEDERVAAVQASSS